MKKYVIYFIFLSLSFLKLNGQNYITVPFNNGFVGNVNNNTSASNCYYHSGTGGLGWTNVQFAQNSSATIFTAQGNDIPGFAVITDFSGIEHSIPGFIKWRTNTGSTVECFVFVPTSSYTLSTNSFNGSNTYTITVNHYIGLTKNGQTLTISPVPGPVTGNAAGVVDDLNTYLSAFVKISVADVTVNEGAGTATVTVSLSAPNSSTTTVVYSTTDGTATAGSDYTATNGTLTFAVGVTSRTFTIPITNDLLVESTETINVTLSDPINASILDGAGIVSIIDNDNCTLSTPVGSVTVQPTCATTTGTIVFTSQSGVEYSIDGTTYQTSATFTGVAAGTYTLKVRSTTDNTCTATGATVTVNAAPSAPSTPVGSVTVQPTCATTTGTIVFTSQSGVEYSIDGTTYQSSATFTGVAAGTYTLKVRSTSDNTCTATGATVTVNAAAGAPSTPAGSVTVQPTCATTTGTIVFTTQSGVEYSIDGTTYQSSATFTGVAAGTYTLKVRSTTDNTCTATGATVTVNAAPSAPSTPVGSVTVQPTCATTTGTIVFTTQSGVEYSIDGTTYQSSATFTGVAAGSYTLKVRSTSDNTCTATGATVNLYGPICAIADTAGPINGLVGATTASVLANDTLNGVAVTASAITLTGVTVPTGLTLNPNGTITIAPNTPAGTLTLTYQICENLNPTNCDTATVTITVAAAVIDAIADTFGPINGLVGATTASVLTNDTLNGVAVTASAITLTGVTVPTGLSLNPNGTITIAPNTPAGTLTLTYQICENLNPTNCDTATVTITVAAAVIDAIADTFGPINGLVGDTTASVLTNDTLNGVAVTASAITLTGVTVPTGLTLNPNGTITIAPNTPAGTLTLTYQICENLNPTNCDTATVTITVAAAVIDAIADTFGPINGLVGDTTASVLTNDTLNGVAVTASAITLTGVTVPTGLTLNPNGTITIAPNTPAGTLTLTYQICENLNPTNCNTATVTITVAAAVIDAIADTFGPINGLVGATTASVLTNDTLNGVAVTASAITLTGVTVPTGLTLNPNGTITIAPNTPAGTLTLTYQICENLNPTNCDTATVTIIIGSCLEFPINDCDGDGVTNGQEILDGTNPSDSCSFQLTSQTVTPSSQWLTFDCDGDGVTNGQEVLDGTNSLDPCDFEVASITLTQSASWNNADCDGDGVTNGQEIIDGTDLNNPCEANMLNATLPLSQEFLEGDCDGDGLTNGEEIGPNPNEPFDPNGNGIPDYLEVNNHTPSDDDLEIFNLVTPNGDGDNDVFIIRNIESYPENELEIYNRWGVKVYSVNEYGKDGKFFRGISEGRVTVSQVSELPVGTYWYILKYKNATGEWKQRVGYLYLNK